MRSQGWTGHMITLARNHGTEDSQQPLCCQALSSHSLPGYPCIRRMLLSPILPFQPASPRFLWIPSLQWIWGWGSRCLHCSGFWVNILNISLASCEMPERASPRCSGLNGRLKWYLHINCSLASVWWWVSQLIDGNNWQPCSRCLLWYLGHNTNDLTRPTLHFAN